jgi:hypothetical protein
MIQTSYPVWQPTLYDSLFGTDVIRIDVSELKSWLKLTYGGTNEAKTRAQLRNLFHSLIVRGVEVNKVRYFVSGATQNTREGVLYAYPEKELWYRYFPSPKDEVRGALAHSPAETVVTITAPMAVAAMPEETWPLGDGQIALSERAANAMGLEDKGDWAQFRLGVEHKGGRTTVKPLSGRNARLFGTKSAAPAPLKDDGLTLLKGGCLVLHTMDGSPLPFDVVYRKEDAKGDTLPDGTYTKLHFAALRYAGKGKQKIGQQTADLFTQGMWDAYHTQWDQIVAEVTELARNPLTFGKFETPLRDGLGRIDVVGFLAHLARVCEKAGSSDLMHLPGVQELLDNWIANKNVQACLGGMVAERLPAVCLHQLPDDVIVVHPKDAPKGFPDGGRAKLMRMPDEGGWRTVTVWLRDHVEVVVSGVRCWFDTRGLFCMNARTGSGMAFDFDGDCGAIQFEDERPIVKAWLDVPNPVLSDVKRRAVCEVMPSHEESILRIFESDVNEPFGLKKKAIVLRHIYREAGDARGVRWCSGVIAILDEQGQRAVDSAKKQSLPDQALLRKIRSRLKAATLPFHSFGEPVLKPEDWAWSYIAKGELKPWLKLDLTDAQRFYFESTIGLTGLPANGEVLMPEDIVSDRTPLGRVFRELGARLPIPHAEVRAHGEFLDKIVLDGSKEGQDAGEELYEMAVKLLGTIANLPDPEEREERRSNVLEWFGKVCANLQNEHAEDKAWRMGFVSRMFQLSVRSNRSKQAILFHGPVESWFEYLEAHLLMWTPLQERKDWSGLVYGVRLEPGSYELAGVTVGEDGKRVFHLKSGPNEWHLKGADSNPALDLIGGSYKVVAHITPRPKGVTNHIRIESVTVGQQAYQEALVKILDAKLQEPLPPTSIGKAPKDVPNSLIPEEDEPGLPADYEPPMPEDPPADYSEGDWAESL